MHRPKSMEELVIDQLHRSEVAREKEIQAGQTCENSIVAISRGMGSGARIIATKLAQELGWSLWSRELLDAMAIDARVSRRVVEAFDERHKSEFELLMHGVLGDHEMAGFMYRKHLANAVTAIANFGNAIILGRGANFLLPNALSVRIDASADLRIRNMITFEDMDKKGAEAKIKGSDKERNQFLCGVFGKERVEHVHHDIDIWMDKFTNDDAVEIIKTAIKARCKPKVC